MVRYKTPSERIVARDHLATAFNADKMLRDRKFIVDLACGHKIYTRNLNKATCPRCTEMLRRSIETGREDWETFRYQNGLDTMEWPNDPCRQFNERLDAPANPAPDK
jgi:hypothetical protein